MTWTPGSRTNTINEIGGTRSAHRRGGTGCITTSGCIRASVIDPFWLGFRVMVPHDCVGDHDAVAHARNLKDVERRYADVIDSAAAIDAIEQWRRPNDRR